MTETVIRKLGLTLPHLHTGGIERGMIQLLNPLIDAGFQITLFLQHREGDLLDQVPPSVTVVDLNGAGVRQGSKALASKLCDHPVDILWSATNAANLLNLLAARRLGNLAPKVVVGEHIPLEEFLATRKFSSFRRVMMRWLYPSAKAITAPLEPILTEHEQLLGRRCPTCSVLPNPVVTSIKTDRPLTETALRFVTLGRLSPEKDYALAVRTFEAVHEMLPDSTLTLHGAGAEHETLAALIRDLGLEAFVTLAGSSPDAATALVDADMLWCTSRVEGFGNVLVEAQSLGVPVASVDCPFGPQVLLEDGQAGLLLRGREPLELASQIMSFAKDQSARLKMQSKGYDVARRYTKDASVSAHVAFFNGL